MQKKKNIFIIGISASGKSTLMEKILSEQKEYTKFTYVTDREKRSLNDNEYDFVSTEKFKDMERSGMFLDVQQYEMYNSNNERVTVSYGIPRKEFTDSETLWVGAFSLKSYVNLCDSGNLPEDTIEVILCDIDEDTQKERLTQRYGKDSKEIQRRMESDKRDLSRLTLQKHLARINKTN